MLRFEIEIGAKSQMQNSKLCVFYTINRMAATEGE